MSIIVYGPQGCGKSKNKESIARYFGVSKVIDNWNPGDPLPDDAIALTNTPVDGAFEYDSRLFDFKPC